jgi:hypothetical protein
MDLFKTNGASPPDFALLQHRARLLPARSRIDRTPKRTT